MEASAFVCSTTTNCRSSHSQSFEVHRDSTHGSRRSACDIGTKAMHPSSSASASLGAGDGRSVAALKHHRASQGSLPVDVAGNIESAATSGFTTMIECSYSTARRTLHSNKTRFGNRRSLSLSPVVLSAGACKPPRASQGVLGLRFREMWITAHKVLKLLSLVDPLSEPCRRPEARRQCPLPEYLFTCWHAFVSLLGRRV